MSDKIEIIVRPTGAALGAEVQGVDLRALDSGIVAAIHRAWLDHQVLLFRDQQLTDEDLVSFSRRFGDLDEAPVQETGQRFVEGHPEIYVVSNVVQDGVPDLIPAEACYLGWQESLTLLAKLVEAEIPG